MARIILKSKYLKPESASDRGGYVGYIATRTGVVMNLEKCLEVKPTPRQIELLNQLMDEYPSIKQLPEFKKYKEHPSVASASEFIDAACEDRYTQISKKEDFLSYIAERPGVVKSGVHGLFTITDEMDSLSQIKNQIKDHQGNIWTHIVSLEREDAVEFGFDTQESWKHLLRKNHFKMAQAMNIEPQHFHWYAAFHDTAHHPHVHIVMYSDDPKQGHLSPKGIDAMKTVFATDIFKDFLKNVYEQKEEVKKNIKTEIAEKLSKIDLNRDYPKIDECMIRLHESLKNHTGKRYYGYLSKQLKQEVDNIMAEIEKIPEVTELLNKWQELRMLQYSVYSDSKEAKFSFVHDKTFRPLKNMIIALASASDVQLSATVEKQLLMLQLSSDKTSNDLDAPIIKTAATLLRYMTKLVKQNSGITQINTQSDHMQRMKEKIQKMALGQNENDTQQFS